MSSHIGGPTEQWVLFPKQQCSTYKTIIKEMVKEIDRNINLLLNEIKTKNKVLNDSGISKGVQSNAQTTEVNNLGHPKWSTVKLLIK